MKLKATLLLVPGLVVLVGCKGEQPAPTDKAFFSDMAAAEAKGPVTPKRGGVHKLALGSGAPGAAKAPGADPQKAETPPAAPGK